MFLLVLVAFGLILTVLQGSGQINKYKNWWDQNDSCLKIMRHKLPQHVVSSFCFAGTKTFLDIFTPPKLHSRGFTTFEDKGEQTSLTIPVTVL